MRTRERWAWVILLVIAAALRLWALDDRPPHHDEAVHGHFAHQLLVNGTYRYDPTYHGPLLFYVSSAIFAVLGETLFTARLYPVVTGVLLVALPLVVRRRLGAGPAWWSGLWLAISPAFLYYSRFFRNDVPVALFTASALALFLLGRRTGWRVVPWVGVLAAFHAISKETFYVTIPLLVVATGALVVSRGPAKSLARFKAWLGEHWPRVVTASLWFIAITLTAYTFVFIHPEDALFPLKAVRYWYEQHLVQRVGGPWYYHLPRIALYEFAIVGLAVLRVVRKRRRLGPLELFCLVWGAASLLMYAYLGEKVPWLTIHQVLPFVPLAGAEAARAFVTGGRWGLKVVTAGLVAGTAWSAFAVTYRYPAIDPADPHAELLVFVQTTRETDALAQRGLALAAGHPGELVAAVSGEASWPLSWQWRGIQVWWAMPEEGSRPPIVVCDLQNEDAVGAKLGGDYTRRRLPLRAWWVEDWHDVRPVQVLRWWVTRRAWSSLGATEVEVFERTDGLQARSGGER